MKNFNQQIFQLGLDDAKTIQFALNKIQCDQHFHKSNPKDTSFFYKKRQLSLARLVATEVKNHEH